ncbi:hypothetical protein ACFV6U_05260 [Streptomyces sp. NPDC059810]|uniref:hypothetical protein n=1 Tax=Streptomyces sp. NPDC059810 TaxID=3346956 RepID=UPI0036568353
MSHELLSPDMSIALDAPQNSAIVSEWLLGTSALLMQHQGETETAELIADVTALEVRLWNTQFDQEGYRVVLVVEPRLYPRYDEAALKRIEKAMDMVLAPSGKDIDEIAVRPEIPHLAAGWRDQLRGRRSSGPKPSNHARRVRDLPNHPVEDDLHFTNEWEYRVYQVLREKQAALPDNETIGIMPLCRVRVLGSTREPDFLITYKGRAGVIEVDGPHHEGPKRASNDHSRTDLLINAGVEWVARLDVRDTTEKAEVEKFVSNFLARLTRR